MLSRLPSAPTPPIAACEPPTPERHGAGGADRDGAPFARELQRSTSALQAGATPPARPAPAAAAKAAAAAAAKSPAAGPAARPATSDAHAPDSPTEAGAASHTPTEVVADALPVPTPDAPVAPADGTVFGLQALVSQLTEGLAAGTAGAGTAAGPTAGDAPPLPPSATGLAPPIAGLDSASLGAAAAGGGPHPGPALPAPATPTTATAAATAAAPPGTSSGLAAELATATAAVGSAVASSGAAVIDPSLPPRDGLPATLPPVSEDPAPAQTPATALASPAAAPVAAQVNASSAAPASAPANTPVPAAVAAVLPLAAAGRSAAAPAGVGTAELPSARSAAGITPSAARGAPDSPVATTDSPARNVVATLPARDGDTGAALNNGLPGGATADAAASPATPVPGPRFADNLQAALAAAPAAAPSASAGASAPAPGAPAQAHAQITTPYDSLAFAPALGAQITLLAREGVQQARIELHPAEMGPISVRIALDGSGARIDFQAEVAATRQVIESSLPALASALRDAGLTLTGGGVFQQSHSPSGQQPGQQSAPGAGAPGARAGDDTGDRPVPVARPVHRRGLVDLVA